MAEGIILAGGKSTRMGQNKMLLMYQNHPLIWYTIQSMKPFVSKIIIVTGRYDKEIKETLKNEDVTFVFNENYEKGMFSSVLKGVKETKEDFFIIPGDCPFVKEDTYRKLLKGNGDIRVPSYQNEDGHPIFISNKYRGELLSMPLDFNLKLFRDSKNYEIIKVEDKNIVLNVNKMTDFENLLR